MKEIIKLFKKTSRDCDLIASWPGIGNVSLILTKYMKEKLNAEEIGTIEPYDFYDPIGVMVKNNIIETPQFPESKFFYWQNPKKKRDLVFFISEEQPSSKGYDLAHCILDIGKKIQVKRIITCAAAIAKIHHTENPKVWGAGTNQKLIEDLKKYDIILKGNLQIAGLNGLFLGAAKERGFDGICLLGEVPSYTTRIANPKAALAVLKAMIDILDIEIDLTDLITVSQRADEQMKRLAAEAMEEFITSYTKPVWPQEDEDEEDEDYDED